MDSYSILTEQAETDIIYPLYANRVDGESAVHRDNARRELRAIVGAYLTIAGADWLNMPDTAGDIMDEDNAYRLVNALRAELDKILSEK